MYSEKKCKVAHILHSVGGVDVSLRLILKNIDSDKFENIIVHGKIDTQNHFTDSKGNTLLSFKTSIFRNISILKDLKSIIETYKIIKKQRPDIIHAHSAKGGIVGKIIGGILGITTFYTPQAFSYLSTQNYLQKKIYILIERLTKGKSILLASSNSERERAIEEVGYSKNFTLLFNNCIEPVNSISSLGIEKTWPVEYICTVGRPSYQKNIELMIKVIYELQKTKKIHLVIMGVGPVSDQLESVKKLIKKLALSDAVTLIDWTDRENIFHIISKSKLYLSTARYEGLPYSVIESLALSKPCVVSHCDGNIDLIEDAYNGFVIKGKNVTEYAQKINLLLNNEELLKKMSDNAKKSFDKNYNILNNISVLEKFYKDYAVK